mgnify:CR=1 FL=1
MSETTTRVLIVDDEWMVRSMLSTIMASAPDIEVVGEAADGNTAVSMAATLEPDVVLMDIRMPRSDGLTATERLTRSPRPPHVVVLTTFDLDEYVQTALRHGAVGFLLKDATRRTKGVQLKWHDSRASLAEGIASRGDRRIGAVIEDVVYDNIQLTRTASPIFITSRALRGGGSDIKRRGT